jgi:hypothetical protein
MAAEDVIGSSAVQAVETSANRLLPGLSDEPAWPTLRGHLLLLAAAGTDPVAELFIAAATRDLSAYNLICRSPYDLMCRSVSAR